MNIPMDDVNIMHPGSVQDLTIIKNPCNLVICASNLWLWEKNWTGGKILGFNFLDDQNYSS